MPYHFYIVSRDWLSYVILIYWCTIKRLLFWKQTMYSGAFRGFNIRITELGELRSKESLLKSGKALSEIWGKRDIKHPPKLMVSMASWEVAASFKNLFKAPMLWLSLQHTMCSSHSLDSKVLWNYIWIQPPLESKPQLLFYFPNIALVPFIT